MSIYVIQVNPIQKKELLEDINLILNEAKELSLTLFIQFKTFLFQYLYTYKEYSLTNIRENGLTEILMFRALRFFNLNEDDENEKQEKKMVKKEKVNAKNRATKSFKVIRLVKFILYPMYLFILLLAKLTNRKSKVAVPQKNRYIRPKPLE